MRICPVNNSIRQYNSLTFSKNSNDSNTENPNISNFKGGKTAKRVGIIAGITLIGLAGLALNFIRQLNNECKKDSFKDNLDYDMDIK